jgi:hypothetical protein
LPLTPTLPSPLHNGARFGVNGAWQTDSP